MPTDPPGVPTAQDIESQRQKLLQMSKELGFPIRIFNDDNSMNLMNLMKVLTGDEYASWRNDPANKSILDNAKANFGVDVTKQALGLAPDVVQGIFGLKQIIDAKKINVIPPDFPETPAKDANLQNELAITSGRATRGMSSQERLAYEEAIRRNQASQIGNLEQVSGGQGAQVAAATNAMGSQFADAKLKEQAMNEQAIRANIAQFDQAVGRGVQETQFGAEFDAERFNKRDMPLFEARAKGRSSVMNAGENNLFNAFANVGKKQNSFLDSFYAGAPGGTDGNVYEPDMTTKHAAIQNINAGAARMMNARNQIHTNILGELVPELSPQQEQQPGWSPVKTPFRNPY